MNKNQDMAKAGIGLSTLQQPLPQSTVEKAGEGLLQAALELEREQKYLLESLPVAHDYQETLLFFARAKQDQVERIEDKIESLIEQQQGRLQQAGANRPGLFSLPSTKAAWQSQQMQQQARIQGLHDRLEAVREIRDGMGIHASRIEELADRKVRLREPELAADFDEMQEAQRRHQALMRKQEQERKKQHEKQNQPSRGQRLGVSQER